MSRFAREDDIAGPTFAEITAKYGEEAVIDGGMVADPDTRYLAKEDSARMRPAAEVALHTVEAWRHGRE